MRTVSALVVLLVIASPAWAEDSAIEEAKVHVRSATASYNLGNYVEAAKEYEAAYKQTLDANLLFNIAQAYRLAGDRDKAITAYRSFIRSAPQSDQRGLAEAKLRDLEQQRPTPAPAPAPQPAEPAPAPPPPAAVVPTNVEPPAQVPPSQTATPKPAGVVLTQPAPGAVPKEESHFYTRWPFWTAVGVAVAGGVALAILLTRGGNSLDMGTPSLGSKEY